MSCWSCRYLRKEVRDGKEVYYCDDYDQVVDPCERSCESDETKEDDYDNR